MDKKDFFILGKITKCNPKTGELTLAFDAREPASFYETSLVFIEIDGGLVPFFIGKLRPKSNSNCLVVLEDFEKPEKAGKLVGNDVYLPNDQLPETSDDQFYSAEIIGYEVFDETHGAIGTIEQVIENSQQEILQIRFNKKEILIPLVDEIFVKINRRQKKLYVNAPDGLIDLYLNE